jgi:hypothetical protein
LSLPLLPAARRDAARLKGAAFIDAAWTLDEWWLRFDCGLTLRAWAESAEVKWSLGPSVEVVAGDLVQRVGAATVTLDFGGEVGRWTMDPSALVARRRGARFQNLFVGEHGLFVYLQDHRILHLGRVERIADGRSILYAPEDN